MIAKRSLLSELQAYVTAISAAEVLRARVFEDMAEALDWLDLPEGYVAAASR